MRLVDNELHLSATDLAGHLGCQHLTRLEQLKAQRKLEPPSWHDPMLEVLRARGEAHEAAYLDYLRDEQGIDAVSLNGQPLDEAGLEATRAATEAGAGAIVQAPLVDGRFRGIADVLLRVEQPSGLGAWSYRVVDTKLASETRAGTILQLCLYTQVVAQLQGLLPDEMWVVSPGKYAEPEIFRTTDYLAYARRVKADLVAAVERAEALEDQTPEPVPQCDVCRWWSRCDKRRRASDHLTFVAGITRLQRRELVPRGVDTLTSLANATVPLTPKPSRGSPESYERAHHQARVQLASRGAPRPVLEYLDDVEEGHGLALLPEPSPGDVFLDLEGDPFAADGGLEYLFGWVTLQDDEPVYASHWAVDAQAEKAAFEELIDTLMDRWQADSGFHVYHFGAYEPAAMKRLMGRYATREQELDRLLRGGRFIDGHAVVKQSLRIGIETYGLKQLEEVHGFTRELDLREASRHKHIFERALELGEVESAPAESRDAVEVYNKDDCVSTWRLRDWLEERRAEQIAEGADLPRPPLEDGLATEEQEERTAELQAIMDALTAGVPADRAERSAEQQACWILAHLLEWHRREKKASWWEFFRLAELPTDDLREEKNALWGLKFEDRIGGTEKAPVDRYSFPPQDHDVRRERTLHTDADTEIGTVEAIDLGARTVDVKKRMAAKDEHPFAVFAKEGVPAKPIPAAIQRLAEWVVEHGIDAPGPYRAARDLLLARAPRVRGHASGALAGPDETHRESAVRLAKALDESVLPIQGPPGTGKTYTGARVICELVDGGNKLGITGPSHKVVSNLIENVLEASAEERIPVQCIQKVRDLSEEPPPPALLETKDNKALDKALATGEAQVGAGTAWAWAREDAIETLDFLVIDEAGQLSLANALAACMAAKNVLLLGDPQQLEQPIQGSHPDGCAASVLEHLLGEHDTIPDDRGLFLQDTWRLHPNVCAFTSELFYEGRLSPHQGCELQELSGPTPYKGAGVHLELVPHEGNTTTSSEEVDRVEAIVADLVQPGVEWTHRDGTTRPLELRDLLIVSPYNAHVAALRERLPGLDIGTVDKFQGREAPVVIYSMATSSADEAPRGLEFLFSLNRLNVATSRARCVCILVASPKLFETECRSPRQIRLANALCRFVEMASAG